MTFPKYKAYKDSGVEWLEEVPSHWEVICTKRFLRLVAEPAPPDNGMELLSVYTEIGVRPRKELEQKGNKASTTDGYWLVQKGDLIVNKLLAWMGAVGYSEYDGVTSPAYDILRPTRNLSSKFYHYLFRGKSAQQEFKRWSRGIMEMRLRLYFDELGHISMPFPPPDEQVQIVAFLDHETARIDALIAEQERLIELLKEKRQAVISHAVTKGLDPTVPMKDSGVEWLGEVPAHWEVARAKHVIQSFEQGWSPQCDNVPVENGEEWGVLKVGCVNGGIFSPTENKRLPDNLDPIPELSLKAGDILISRANTRELVGSAALVDADQPNLMLSDKLFRLRATEDILPRYLVFYLGTNAVRHQIELEATGASSSMLNIGQAVIKELSIPVPPIAEQQAITAQLETSLKKLYFLQKEAQLTQSLLQERRSALISAAVTGRIDVRGWQAPESHTPAASLETAYG